MSAGSHPSAPSNFLLQHFDRLAEAPGGIAKLRALIVQLGIQGKLVAQDKTDEPVANLLARIRNARPKLIAAGEAQKLKDLPEIADSDLPFEIPDSWEWVHLAELTAYIQRGKSPVYEPGSAKFVLNQKCIQWDGLHLEYAKEVSSASLVRYEPVRFLRSGDILWNSTGTGTIGRCLVFRPTAKTPPNLAVDGHVTVVRTIEVEPDYIQRWLMSSFVYGVIEQRASGATNQVELTSTMATEQLISLPPIAEQRRIVAKVEELMVLCDALEAAQRERETTRTRLRASALHQLASPDSDSKSAAFVLQNLPLLTTVPEDLFSFRDLVSWMAVEGELAPGEIKNWSTDKFENVVELQGGVTKGRNLVGEKTVELPYLRVANVQRGHLELDVMKVIEIRERESEKYALRTGDLVITEGGDWDKVGRTAVWREEIKPCIHQNHIFRARADPKRLHPEWGMLALNSRKGRDYFADASKQTTNLASINMSQLRRFPIPLPPLAEQRRIVAKVDELMAVLDALGAALTTARTTAEKLLAATVARLHAA